MVKEHKRGNSLVDIDQNESSVLKRDGYTYTIDEEDIDFTAFLESLAMSVREELKIDNLSDNEFKVGYALAKILEDWRELFSDTSDGKNSTKFNKNLILLYIRNMTGLNTKEIRNSMKRFKSLYKVFKNDYLDD